MSRSSAAAEVLAAIPRELLVDIARQFPPAADIGLRADLEYFRKVMELSHDFPGDQEGRRQALLATLAKRQQDLSRLTHDYRALQQGDLSSLDDKTIVQRFKKDPRNGMHVTLFMLSNCISFERTMIAVLMDEIDRADRE